MAWIALHWIGQSRIACLMADGVQKTDEVLNVAGTREAANIEQFVYDVSDEVLHVWRKVV